MRSRQEGPPALLPHIVATGFTTAYLGDERTLREFVVGDHVVSAIRSRGDNAILYLINDSYDPLMERQLRVAVNKDAEMIERFRPFCGRPIAEIPDPYECHSSYSEHFAQSLVDRLHALDIYPVLLDSYEAYQRGHYQPFVSRTFDHYREIQEQLEAHFQYTLRNLFRIQCPECRRIDGVEITRVEDGVSYHCECCGFAATQGQEALRGKLNWKLDCAARWNLYRIDTEVFAKAHLAEKGTLNSSRYVSEHFFGGQVPEVVKYGDFRISRDLSGQLLRMLPSQGLKQLLTENLETDLDISAHHIEHFASTFEVRPGMSYLDYIRKELPRKALDLDGREGEARQGATARRGEIGERELVEHANAFSEFYYRRHHGVRLPDARALAGVDVFTTRAALDVVGYALDLRKEADPGLDVVKQKLKSHLAERPSLPAVYPLLRRLFGQNHGPNITTLLALLPVEYLRVVQFVLRGHAGIPGNVPGLVQGDSAAHEEAA